MKSTVQFTENAVLDKSDRFRYPTRPVLANLDSGAVNYTLKRWVELTRFLNHPVIGLSTNWAENSIRPTAIGRRDWLHLGSKEAGPKIAAIFSIVESYRKLGVPIRRYLADVLPSMADRTIQQMAGLTPTAYAANMTK